MSDAIIQECLHVVLVDEKEQPYDWRYPKSLKYNKTYKELFKMMIEKLKDDLPYCLEHYRGKWSAIKPTKTAWMMKQQIDVDYWKNEVARLKECKELCERELVDHIEECCECVDDVRCGHYYAIQDYVSDVCETHEDECDEAEYQLHKAQRIQKLGSYDAYCIEYRNDDYYDT